MRVSWPRRARPFGLVGTTIAAGLLAAGAALGCGGAQGANDPNRPVVPYSGRQADLFDDTIEPAAVGLDFEKGYAPRLDKALRERAQVGDAVLRVRVSTVTAKTDGPDAIYQLGLHTVEKLAGEHPPPVDFTVQIDKSSESHGIMKNFESRMVGYAFVAFVREFAHPSGDRELHFHLAPDTKDVKAAVGDAMLLGELR
ncbi:MAG: cobalamin ABC transporter substrate-binding protein [Labilithrix sp.]|nr:cobalamin ABC transporter substrate-binding protein [Labilithrix sp.]MCW5833821.1 cobalamin ABC transporter substrate-binding protein [Labilithrix sp.]